jgi:phosphotriesterase-related protein
MPDGEGKRMAKMIHTALGPVSTADLGQTLTHEHVVSANWNMRMCYPDWFDRDEFLTYAAEDVRRTRAVGVSTLVDVTPVCLGRDTGIVREVAQRTGMQIVCATGFFFTENQWMYNRSMESFLRCLMHDIEQGLDGTDVLPGIIKCCTDIQGVTPINEKLLTASAIAAKESGLPVATHATWKNDSAQRQMDILEKQGVPLDRVVIGHCGDTNDADFLEAILRRGSYVGLDRFGDEEKNSLENRVNTLMELCGRGWLHKILISHDYVSFVDIGPFEWRRQREKDPDDAVYNSRYIHRHALPLLREKGFPEESIGQLLIGNPRAYFET